MDPTPLAPLAPGAVIGMLGGGQLGRMAALAAARLGYRCHIYCPEPGAPASQVTDLSTIAPYGDEAALARFAEQVDVVAFEFENIPFPTVEVLARRVPVRPRPEILRICQNRVREKDFCRSIAVATAPFAAVASADDLERAVATIGRPCVLKTAEMGYDGKGQTTIGPGDDLARAWQATGSATTDAGAVVEGFVNFRLEISVLVARAADGACAIYDPVENRHRNHILHQTIVPAPIPAETAERARDIARRLAEALDLVGLLAIEMFVTSDGEVLVNELAPRPHNSGHWTLDACLTSQFEQFIRAVAGQPLGATTRLADAVMTNLLGDEVEAWREILAEPGAKLHLYGKQAQRPGRKMGHVTRLTPLSRSDTRSG